MSARARTVPVADQTAAGEELTHLILLVFRLNGALLEVAEQFADMGGLTAARWQVLGGVLDRPRSVSEVARQMGLTRQSVQRLANVLVDDGFATWRENPSHRRAKLLAPTARAMAAIDRIAAVQHPWSDALGGAVGQRDLAHATTTLEATLAGLEEHRPVI